MNSRPFKLRIKSYGSCHLSDHSNTTTLCGISIIGYESGGWIWLNSFKTEWKPCKKCISIAEKELVK